MKGLTERQREILLLIVAGMRQGRPPSQRELSKDLGVTGLNGVHQQIQALVKKGYLTTRGHQGRMTDSYELTDLGKMATYESEPEMEALALQYLKRFLPDGALIEVKVRYPKG